MTSSAWNSVERLFKTLIGARDLANLRIAAIEDRLAKLDGGSTSTEALAAATKRLTQRGAGR